MVSPARRFALATCEPLPPLVLAPESAESLETSAASRRCEVTRLVGRSGKISLCRTAYYAGTSLAVEAVAVALSGNGLVETSHRGVLIASHGRRHGRAADPVRERRLRARPQTAGRPVLRKVDPSGAVSLAGTAYRVGNRHHLEQIEVRVVGETVEISQAGRIIRTHA